MKGTDTFTSVPLLNYRKSYKRGEQLLFKLNSLLFFIFNIFIKMKKTILAVCVLLAGFTTTMSAGNTNKTNKKNKATANVVKLTSRADSLSYASGLFSTGRLMEYLKGQYGLTENDLAAFVQGFKDARAKQGDKAFSAYNAGVAVFSTVQNQVVPTTRNAFKDSSDSLSLDPFYQGFVAGVLKDSTLFTFDNAEKYFSDFYKANEERKVAAVKAENEKWLKDNATKEGVKTTASGLQYKVITEGHGAIPKATDMVTVKYVGRTIDGTEFDNSYKRNPQETTFGASQVIAGWTEALTMMPVGSKWQLYIPAELAYKGSSPTPAIKPFSTLIFDVELVRIEDSGEKKAVEPAKVQPKKKK